MAGVEEWQKTVIYDPGIQLINIQQQHPQHLTSLQPPDRTKTFLYEYTEVKQSPHTGAEASGDAPVKHRAVSGAVAVTST